MPPESTQLNFKGVTPQLRERIVGIQESYAKTQGRSINLTETLEALIDAVESAHLLKPAESAPLSAETLQLQRHLESVAVLFGMASTRLSETERYWAQKLETAQNELEKSQERIKSNQIAYEEQHKQHLASVKSLENAVKEANKRYEREQKAFEAREKQLTMAETLNSALVEDKKTLQRQLTEANSRQQELENTLKSTQKTFSEELGGAQKLQKSLDQQLDKAEKTLASTQIELAMNQETAKRWQQLADERQAKEVSLSEKLEQAQEQIQQSETEKGDLKASIAALKTELQFTVKNKPVKN